MGCFRMVAEGHRWGLERGGTERGVSWLTDMRCCCGMSGEAVHGDESACAVVGTMGVRGVDVGVGSRGVDWYVLGAAGCPRS